MALEPMVLSGAYTKDRLTREEAKQLSKEVIPILRKVSPTYELAGSYRRGSPSVGDLDFVVVNCDLGDLLARLVEKMGATKAPRAGSSVLTAIVPFGKKKIQVEFVNVKPRSIGSALLHSTGSGEFNMGLRGLAKGKGMLLSQHGLFRDDKFVAGKTEESVFKALGLAYIPPEDRDVPFAQLLKRYLVDKKAGEQTKKPKDGKTWKVIGSKGDIYYVTYNQGQWKCTCKGFKFHQFCSHLAKVQEKIKVK